MQMDYGVDDMVASLTQTVQDQAGVSSTSVMSYGLDPVRRVQTITTTIDGAETKRLRYRFATEGDSPAVVETSTDQGASWTSTRYVSVPEVGMAASVTGGVGSLQVANLHGDIVATVLDTNGSTALDSWTETDEYGNQVEPVATGVSPARYGYLGTHQRATDTPGGGLTLMGARLYNPVTGAFLSIDSVPGGNVTPYTYPQDPVNQMDPSGRETIINKIRRYELMAAACASVGRAKCVAITQWSLRINRMFPKQTAKGNWVRHFVWIAVMSWIADISGARLIAASHEFGLPLFGSAKQQADSLRDSKNNRAIFYILKNSLDSVKQFWINSGRQPDAFLRRLGLWAQRRWDAGWGERTPE